MARAMPVNRIAHYVNSAASSGTGVLVKRRPHRARTRVQSLGFALHGLREAWHTEPNLRLHAALGAFAIVAGMWCRLTLVEWLWVSFAIGLVLFAELMNTAIEQTVDLVVGNRPDPLARRVKDVSAGCVLTAAILAVVIGALTFVPHLAIVAHRSVGS